MRTDLSDDQVRALVESRAKEVATNTGRFVAERECRDPEVQNLLKLHKGHEQMDFKASR